MEPINQFLDRIITTPQTHIICTYQTKVQNETLVQRKTRFITLSNKFGLIFKLLALSIEQTPKQVINTTSQFFGNKCKMNEKEIKIYPINNLGSSNSLYLLEPTTLSEFNLLVEKINQSQTQNNLYLWMIPSDIWDLDLTLFMALPNHQIIDLNQLWNDREINQWLNQNKKMLSEYNKELIEWFIAKITGNAPIFLSELNHPVLMKRKEQMEKLIEIYKKQILSWNLDIILKWGNMEIGIATRSAFKLLL